MSFSSVNKVMILGRLGKDPETIYTQGGMAISKFSVATSESFKGKDGNFQEKTEWHNIVVFGSQAENCAKFLYKGSLVFIEGRIQTEKYQDKNGVDKYKTEIVANSVRFLDPKDKFEPAKAEHPFKQTQPTQGNLPNYEAAYNQMKNNIDPDDDLPF